ncbi:MAG TPA: YoaK family protein [Candidatus Acidoferrales bacterium]|nr:YoaK family protein [Candidatus Acidoferrales bacterium]
MNARLLVLLSAFTLAAGYSDAVAFFGLGVFTANMTGNTVLLGGALAARFVPHFQGTLTLELPAVSILCFAAGACLAALVLRGETGRPPVRTMLVVGFAAALLVGAALLFTRNADARLTPLCVALLSSVMGLQSVVAVRLGVPGVSTTYVTGTLVTAVVDFLGVPRALDERREAVPNIWTWALYLGGAAAGTFGLGVLGNQALWPAAVVVALLIPVL